MRYKNFTTILLGLILLSACGQDEGFGSPEYGNQDKKEADPDEMTSTVLFKNGEKIGEVTYATFRIPSLVRTKDRVIALCEARTVNADRGDIDIACRVSTDDGKTWGEKKVLFSDGIHTVGNPCCVYTASGRLVMVFNWHVSTESVSADFPTGLGVTSKQKAAHGRRVFVTVSEDQGTTWDTPRDITDIIMEPNWSWNAAGPCHALQLRTGAYKGRIIVPCDLKMSNVTGRDRLASYVIYSDDDGVTWKKSDLLIFGNESCAAERSDGKIHLDMRNANSGYYQDGFSCRAWSLSSDGGQTWDGYHYDLGRPEPTNGDGSTKGCQGSVINYDPDGAVTANMLFSNPASATARRDMTLRFSKNDGTNWTSSLLITENPAGYSDLVVLKDGSVGLFYETGPTNYHQTITFARIPKRIITEHLK